MKLDLENNNYLFLESINALDDKDKYDEIYRNLSKQRKQKVDKLISLDDKKRSMLVEVLLDKILKVLSIKSEINLKYNVYGKPFFNNLKDVHFNISHSSEYVICVVSKDEIGCDIQEVKDVNIKGISKYFTKKEYDDIINSSDPKELFYRYWTAKESYIKNIGLGFAQNINNFTVDLNKHVVQLKENSEKHYLFEGSIGKYRYCVCSNNKDLIIYR